MSNQIVQIVRDGRILGTYTPTPEDEDGTGELLLEPEVSQSLHDYVLVCTEACLGDPTDHWRALGFQGAPYALLWHMSSYRYAPPREEIVRLFTIDEVAHGPLDFAIGEIHTALRRIEEERELARKIRADFAGFYASG